MKQPGTILCILMLAMLILCWLAVEAFVRMIQAPGEILRAARRRRRGRELSNLERGFEAPAH